MLSRISTGSKSFEEIQHAPSWFYTASRLISALIGVSSEERNFNYLTATRVKQTPQIWDKELPKYCQACAENDGI